MHDVHVHALDDPHTASSAQQAVHGLLEKHIEPFLDTLALAPPEQHLPTLIAPRGSVT